MENDLRNYLDFFKHAQSGLKEKTGVWYRFLKRERDKGNVPFGRVQRSERTRASDLSGKQLVMLGSNDYLGLSKHPRVVKAMHQALDDFGSGTSGSPLLSGRYDVTRALEQRIAALHGMEDAIAFSSTYAANIGLISGLLSENDVALLDSFSHTSIDDGALMAGCKKLTFRHNDIAHLTQRLEEIEPERTLVFVDSVYSMEGSFCPLVELSTVTREKGATLAVDEAHALGVVGVKGGGLTTHLNVSDQVDIITGSLGKSLGSHGGYAASTKEMCEYLRFNAHSYMFSSGLPPVNAATALAALDVMEEEDLCARLQDNIRFMREKLTALGFKYVAVDLKGFRSGSLNEMLSEGEKDASR